MAAMSMYIERSDKLCQGFETIPRRLVACCAFFLKNNKDLVNFHNYCKMKNNPSYQYDISPDN